jgi:hypothetical protein
MPEKIWPVYGWYGVSTVSEIIDIALATLRGKRVQDQLRQQNIRSISIYEFAVDPYSRRGTLNVCTGGWFDIEVDKKRSIVDVVRTVGHELAHTFEYCRGSNFFPGWLMYDFDDTTRSIVYYPEIEQFATTFANKWMEEGKNYQITAELLYAHRRRGIIRFIKRRKIRRK